jgi:hypothetical protein
MSLLIAENPELAQTIGASAEWINGLLMFSLGLAGTIVLLKAFGQDEVEVWKVKIKTGQAWIIFGLLTVAHAFLTVELVKDSYDIFYNHHDLCKPAWESLRGLLFFKNMVPRVHVRDVYLLGHPVHVYKIDIGHDLASWLIYAGVIVVFLAIFDFKNRSRRLSTSFAAALICSVNWFIGSQWAVAVSDLASGGTTSAFFEALRKRFGM